MAVKVFRLDIVPEQAQSLAEALTRATEASLFHPSIVEPIAAGVEGTLAYRAEEYVAAESLDVAMRHYAPAPIEKALPFITQLAGAIDFARAAGVGHGGLHPRDIFMTPDEARATGFGVVEALERVGIRAPIRRPYTAPERIDGAPWGAPADVFSLAAITFELLTARRPAGTGAQIGVLPDGARSAALQAVLARGMDEDPARRYASALAFAGALESAARGEPEASAISDVAAIAAPVPVPEIPARARGELEIEAAPDPAFARTADVTSFGEASREAAPAPTLFDPEVIDADEIEVEPAVEAERFADEFVEQEADEPEPVLTAVPHDDHVVEESVYAAEEPMFAAAEPEPEQDDEPERSSPAILPMAVTAVLCLLVGFAAGYFVGSRDRLVPAAESAAAVAAPAAPAGAATPETPGQYSEQKVTAPAAAAPPDAAPPPATGAVEGAAPAPPNRAPAPSVVEGPAVEASRPERAARAGHLVVRSTPPRAAVTVNGQWRGRTPLTLDALPFGTYVVRIVQSGFRVAREEVTLSAKGASHTINARLERTGADPLTTLGAGPSTKLGAGGAAAPPGAPAVSTGALYVDSRPRGATVLVDGKPVGQTPLTLADVAIGSHVVQIEMAGKKPWTRTALVTAGKTERVTGSLDDR